MQFLRLFRENKIVNFLLRKTFKKSAKLSSKIHSFLINHWPPSGILDCNFGSYKFKYYSKCDDGFAHDFYYDLPFYEKADLNLFIELAKKSEVIVDIGANTGLYSVLAGSVNAKSKIHAIEPYKANADRLKINLALNSVKNVEVYEIAVGEREGEIQLTVPKNNVITDVASIDGSFSKSIYPDMNWESQTVKLKTLDGFAMENKIQIDLIKCDVETFEMSVFKGAERILAEDKPTIIFECFLNDERKIFFNNILRNHNYYVYLLLEQGIVYIQEGFINAVYGRNYLISPVKPSKTFISYVNVEELWKGLLLRPKLN